MDFSFETAILIAGWLAFNQSVNYKNENNKE
jgi:hypothetical protein